MQCRSAQKSGEVGDSGVTLWDGSCNPCGVVVSFSVSIITTKLWDSNYSEYQEHLYNRICGYKEKSVTPIGYRKISKILNEEGLLSPMGKPFTNVIVFGLYNKGKIREERVNREDIVEVSQPPKRMSPKHSIQSFRKFERRRLDTQKYHHLVKDQS